MVATTLEEVIGRTEDGRVIVYFECLGTDSYQSGAGGFLVNIASLRAVERILELGNLGGYRTEPEECTISANTIKIPVRWYGYGCATACAIGWEVGYDVNLSGVKFSGVVIGH